MNKLIRCRKGSALVMAVVTASILLILGMAVIAASENTLNINAADATTTDAYYAAEASARSAMEHLKNTVSEYYIVMSNQSANYSDYYNGFYNNIGQNATGTFVNPVFENATIDTTFRTVGVDPDKRTFIITSTAATADGTEYVVQGSLDVERVNINNTVFFPAEYTLYAGGTTILSDYTTVYVDGYAVVGSDPVVGSGAWFWASGGLLYEGSPGAVTDSLEFKTPVVNNPNPFVDVSMTFTSLNMPSSPIAIDTANGTNLKFQNCTVPYGTIVCKGNVVIDNSYVYADIYCDGDVFLEGGGYYGKIYCKGNVYLNGGTESLGNIISYGKVNITDNLYYLGGIVYARQDINVGFRVWGHSGAGRCDAVLISGKDIWFEDYNQYQDMMLIARGNIHAGSGFEIYTLNMHTDLMFFENEFQMDTGGTPSNGSVSSDIFTNEKITAVGRK